MSLFNSLNNITTDKITIDKELILNDVNITDIIPSYNGQTITDKNHKLPTIKFIEDFVDIQDDNFAKLNVSNEFLENNTFKKNVIVQKYNNDTLTSELTISGDTIKADNTNDILTLQDHTTITTTTNNNISTDSLTTDNININDTITTNKLNMSDGASGNYTITSIQGAQDADNTKLATKGYVDSITTDLSDCARKSLSNTFTKTNIFQTDGGNSTLSINGPTISTSNTNADTLTIKNSTITTSNNKDTLNIGFVSLSDNLTVSGTSSLNGTVNMGSKSSNKTSLTTTSNLDTFQTDNIITDTIKIPSSGSYIISGITGSSETGAINSNLTTQGYVDEKTADLVNCAKVNTNNTFQASYTQTFSGPVITSDVLNANGGITTSSGNLNISSTGQTINLGNKSSNKSNLTTSTNASSQLEDTLTTDNIILNNNLTVSGETTLTSPVYLGSKSAGDKSSLITITEDNVSKDTFTTDNIILSEDLEVNGDSILSGDIVMGKKSINQTELKSNAVPGSEPTEYKDTFTTDNIIIRESLTINGELDANIPTKYNYAYLYDETNNYYTYNNINYVYDSTNHNFKVIGFRNNKNNTFIIEPYLIIDENNNLVKYPVVNVDNTFNYTINNIDSYVYLPETFDYVMCAFILNHMTVPQGNNDNHNIYISILFNYDMYINITYEYLDSHDVSQSINTELIFTHKTIYYIIRNPSYDIDINNKTIFKDGADYSDFNNKQYQIGIIFSNPSLYIINLANIHNSYIGYITCTTIDYVCNLYQLTSNIEIIKNKIIESHYNMYLVMQNNRKNYLQQYLYDELLYIKQYQILNEETQPENYELTNTILSPYNEITISGSSGDELIYYIMNKNYDIYYTYYNNSSYQLNIYLNSINNFANNPYELLTGGGFIKLSYNYSNTYSIDNIKQCYFIDNLIYILCSANSNTKRLLFIFDIENFNNKKMYEFNNIIDEEEIQEYTIPNKLLFNYNKNNDVYELFAYNNNNKIVKLQLENDIFYYTKYNIDVVLDSGYSIIDLCYVKPYIIILSKNTSESKYKIYYCSNIKLNYWQYLNISLPVLSSGEYYLNTGKFSNNKNTIPSEYEYNQNDLINSLYITNSDHNKGAKFNSYKVETLLMRI